jgi:threonine aldolase
MLFKAETNQIFAKIPMSIINELHKDFHFYIYNPKEEIVRFVTSFDTSETDVNAFGEKIKHLGK